MGTLGIDIGGSSVKAALLDTSGQSIGVGQSARYLLPDTAQLVDAIREAIRPLRLPRAIAAVGLCVPGLLDVERQVVTLAVNVPGLMGLPLTEVIAQVLPPLTIDRLQIVNDAIATAQDIVIAQQLIGRTLVLAMGTGIGAAVMDRPSLDAPPIPLHVDGESSGHLGQMDVSIEIDPPSGPDGGAGSLEAYCGAAAFRAAYPDAMDAGQIAFERIQPNDLSCQAIIRAIRIAHAMYRPHHVVLAGGIGVRLKALLGALRSRINDNLTSVARADWSLDVGEDDHHAARGAARIAAAARSAFDS